MDQAAALRKERPEDAAGITWRDFINPGTQFNTPPAATEQEAPE
jgi:hypothetical protein